MLIFDQLKRSDARLRVIAVCILLGMSVLLAGLWRVQVFASKRYWQDLRKQAFRSVRVPAIRGKILDRNGDVLAENRPSYTINIYLEELRELFQDEYLRLRPTPQRLRMTRAERTALNRRARYSVVSNIVNQLGKRLELPIQLNEEQFHIHFNDRLALPLPVIENLSSNQIARYFELGPSPPGVELEAQPLRSYPRGTVAGHVLGYLARSDKSLGEEDLGSFHYRLPDFEGKIGIEAAYDSDLRGRAGAKSMLVNSLGYRQSETIGTASEPGKNVVLTLNLKLQEATERALRTTGTNTRGAAIVVNPRNGDILAMASSPAIDPNEFIGRISQETWQRLSDPKLRPQLNRATQGIYAPGSTLKMIMALALFEAGIDPDETVPNSGAYQLGRRSIGDHAPKGDHNFRNALKFSSNSYFIHQGLKIGLDRILAMGHRFMLGELTGIPTLQDNQGFFPTPEWLQRERARGNPWTDGDTANLSIGQGFVAATPLQLAMVTATVANGGTLFWPRLVMRVEAQDLTATNATRVEVPTRIRNVIRAPAAHWDTLREGMLAVVEETGGTAHDSAVSGIRICGKTGTAEVKKGHVQVDKITWFVSFAPFESPTHVVVVMVESGGSGGGTCAPIARFIYQAIQQYDREARKTAPLAQVTSEPEPFPPAKPVAVAHR